MRTSIFSFLIIASLLMMGCGSSGGNNSSKQTNQHSKGDGHNHGKDDGHNHSKDDGHNHGKDDGHNHSKDDGHGHDECDGHDHGKDDGHNHGKDDGHNHGKDDGHGHDECDGHDHGKDDGHNHGKDDGHNHGKEKAEKHSKDDGHGHYDGDGHDHGDGSHADEIAFTKEQAKAVGLKTETVKPRSFRHVIKTSGQIQTPQGNEQTIVATSTGTVSFVNSSITDGAMVKAGESIVMISSKNLQDGDPAIKAKIAFETAEKEYKRAESLVADKIISAKQFEQARSAYENAKNAYQAQAANVTAAGIRVTSPISGYIKNRLVNHGDYVSVGQPIATVAQNKRLQLRADVSENHFKYLKSINSANFKTAYDNSTYKLSELNGKLLSYGKTSNSSSSYIPVTFEFDNVSDIIPGSFTEIYLLSSPRNGVLSVPVSALTEEQGLNFVYIQVEPEAFVKREVTVGQNNGERAEILKGINVGDAVVVNGAIQVKLASASGEIPHGHSH